MTKTKNKKISINRDMCKECGLCVFFCPDKALEFEHEFNPKGYHPVKWKGACSFCGRCCIVCPDSVMEIIEE